MAIVCVSDPKKRGDEGAASRSCRIVSSRTDTGQKGAFQGGHITKHLSWGLSLPEEDGLRNLTIQRHMMMKVKDVLDKPTWKVDPSVIGDVWRRAKKLQVVWSSPVKSSRADWGMWELCGKKVSGNLRKKWPINKREWMGKEGRILEPTTFRESSENLRVITKYRQCEHNGHLRIREI